MATPDSLQAAPRSVRALEYVTVAVVLAYVGWTLPGVRTVAGFDVARDGVLQGAGYVLVTLLAVVWAARRTADPAAAPLAPAGWLLVAGIGLRTLGFVLTLTFLSRSDPLPYPSVADVAWVLSSIAIIAGVVLRIRTLAPRLSLLVALDALAASLVLVGLVVGVLSGPVRTLAGAPGTQTGAIITNVVYPIIDAALLVALAALVSAGRARLTVADVLLVLSVIGSVVVDVTFFVLLAEGLWRPGTLLGSVSLVSTAVLAVAVHGAAAPAAVRRRLLGDVPVPTLRPGPVVPAAFVGISLLGLTVSSLGGASPVTILCFGLTGLVAVVRGVRTFNVDRDVVGVALGAATTDLRQFQALVEASSDLIGMADSDGNILYLNPEGRRLLRLPADRDVRTLTVADVVPGAGEASFSKRWPLLLERGRWEGEAELHPLDGSEPVPVAISTFVMYETETREPFALATVQRDIRDLRRQEAALREVADQRARLLTRLVRAQEAERSRIAADVHDDSVQALAVVDLRMGGLRRRIARAAPDLLETVDDLQQAVSSATDRLRHLLFDLESPSREAGLRAALSTAAEVIFTDTDVAWQVNGDADLGLGDAERITAYRVAMEAMVNARKHAGADHVTVSLQRGAEELTVTVQDDGRGIRPEDEQERPGHQGLASMRDRVVVAGGELQVGLTPEGGTEVRLSLPARTVDDPARTALDDGPDLQATPSPPPSPPPSSSSGSTP